MSALGVTLIFAYVLFVGFLANQFGVSVDVPAVPESPGSDPGLFDLVSWFWNNLSGFFKLATFQIPGLFPLVPVVVDLVTLMMLWAALRMIRGN